MIRGLIVHSRILRAHLNSSKTSGVACCNLNPVRLGIFGCTFQITKHRSHRTRKPLSALPLCSILPRGSSLHFISLHLEDNELNVALFGFNQQSQISVLDRWFIFWSLSFFQSTSASVHSLLLTAQLPFLLKKISPSSKCAILTGSLGSLSVFLLMGSISNYFPVLNACGFCHFFVG